MKRLEGSNEDCPLQFRFVGLARRVPERVIQKRGARRVDCLGDVQRTTHAEGGNAGSFGVARDQSHGLMADRSHGNEQSDIDLFCQQPRG